MMNAQTYFVSLHPGHWSWFDWIILTLFGGIILLLIVIGLLTWIHAWAKRLFAKKERI